MTPNSKYRDRLLTAAYEFANTEARGGDGSFALLAVVDAIMEEICEREDARCNQQARNTYQGGN